MRRVDGKAKLAQLDADISELHEKHNVRSKEYVQEAIKIEAVLGKDASRYEKYEI